jgi:hypothetical protein
MIVEDQFDRRMGRIGGLSGMWRRFRREVEFEATGGPIGEPNCGLDSEAAVLYAH